MSKLLHTLLSLRQPGGQPDPEARRLELDSLVRHLTVPEIRRLRMQLSSVTLPFDICAEFPTELLLCIAEYLDLEDVIRARSVCRSWNKTFSSSDICIGIIKTHFRPVWEKRYRCLDAGQQLVEKEALRQWLSGAANHRIRRQHGRYHSMSIYHQFDHTIEDWQYKNGRVAFKPSSAKFIVRDLRTNLTVNYMDENRVEFTVWSLSDKFLIALKNGPISLRAWSLSSAQTENIRLPGPVKRITAHQNQVGIVTTTNEILLWCVGGPLRSVDVSGLHGYLADFRLIQALVVFHPLEGNCFFVAYEAAQRSTVITEKDTHRILVQEFKEGVVTSTKLLDLHSSEAPSLPIIGLVDDGIISISGVFLGQPPAGVDPNRDVSESWLRLGLTERKKSNPKTFVVVTFDIYRGRFALEHYCLPGPRGFHSWETVLEQAFFWRNQVSFPFPGENGTAFEIEQMPPDALLVAINEHSNHISPRRIPRYGPVVPEIYPAEAKKLSDIAYYWTADIEFATGAATNHTTNFWLNSTRNGHCAVVQGDDNFVVLLAMNEFVVWCFDQKFEVPVRNSDPNAPAHIVHLLSS